MNLALQDRRAAQHGRAAVFLLLAVATVAAVAALLLRFPPQQYGFYPACPVYALLDLQCPGCGATRALAALLNGHLQDAINDNALFVLGVLPGAGVYLSLVGSRLVRGANEIWPVLPKPVLYCSLAVTLGFAILRNLLG